MAGFEDLIRGALVKQGNTTPESREKIYASARQALDRMISENSNLDPNVVESQRTKLEDAISKIESDQTEDATEPDLAAAPEEVISETEVEETTAPKPEVKPETSQSAPAPKPDASPEVESAKPDTPQKPIEKEEVEPAAEAPKADEDLKLEPAVDTAKVEVEEEPVPKIELSDPAPQSDAVQEPEEPIKSAETPAPSELPDVPKVSEETKAVELTPEPTVDVSDPAPAAQPPKPAPEPEDATLPKIELSDPVSPLEVSITSPSAQTVEPDTKPFSLEVDASPDISSVAPAVAVAAAAATLDLSKGTRTAPDLVADKQPQRATPVAPSGRVEPSVDTPVPVEKTVEQPAVDVEKEAPKPVRLQYEPEAPEIHPQSYTGNALNERKPYAKMLLWTIILVGLGVALWWAVTFGPALIKAQLDGSVPNPRATLESGSFIPGGGNADGWVTVFVPDANEDDIIPGTSSIMELQRENGRQVMRMASPDNSSDNNLKIRISRGVMESLRGKAATFELVIRSTTAENQEFVLFCEFSKMGNCGRKRFSAGSNSEPFIFDVLVNDVALPANEEAYLSLNTDFSGKGRALDLYSVRVRTGS